MPTRIAPVKPGEAEDAEINKLLQDGRDGWWADPAMFGVIARGNPNMLKTIIPVFGSFFGTADVEGHIHELMRIKTGNINDCNY